MSAPLRVLFVSNIGTMSGGEHVLLDLIEDLAPDVDPTVLAPKGDLLDACTKRGIEVRRSFGLRELQRAGKPWWPLVLAVAGPLAVKEILFRALSTSSSIVHANNFAAGLYASLAARLGRKSFVWTIQDLFPAESREARVLVRVARRADRIIAVSQAVADNLIALGVASSTITVVHNSVDAHDRFDPERVPAGELRRALDIAADVPIVTTVGQITSGKGIHILLDAARLLLSTVKAHFVIAGDAPPLALEYARDLRRETGRDPALADRVTFLGPRQDIPSLLADTDIYVQGSVHPESFGMAVLEAMAMGKVVVAPRAGGIPEVVTADTGLLYDPGDAAELAHHLTWMIDHPIDRYEMGRRARARAAKEFPPSRRARETLAVYRELTR